MILGSVQERFGAIWRSLSNEFLDGYDRYGLGGRKCPGLCRSEIGVWLTVPHGLKEDSSS